jgi:hypothetical protein
MNSSQKFIIVKDRVEIYKDFALNLLYYIHKYYLGKDILCEDTDIYNHYSFCYNKVCEEFFLEGLDFSDNAELKEYFFTYYYHQFYKISKDNMNQDTSQAYYEKFWRNIFEFTNQKNKNILNILIELYTICDKSINQEKNILEIV